MHARERHSPRPLRPRKSPLTLMALSGEAISSFSTMRVIPFKSFERAVALYTPIIERITRETLDEWAQLGSFTLHEKVKPFAFRMATFILLGFNLSRERSQEYMQLFETWLNGFMGLPFNLPFTVFGKAMKARSKLLEITEEAILQQMRANQEDVSDEKRYRAQDGADHTPSGKNVLSILAHDLHKEEGLNMVELKDQVILHSLRKESRGRS